MRASKPVFIGLVSRSGNVLSRVLPLVQHHASRVRGSTAWTKSDQEVLVLNDPELLVPAWDTLLDGNVRTLIERDLTTDNHCRLRETARRAETRFESVSRE